MNRNRRSATLITTGAAALVAGLGVLAPTAASAAPAPAAASAPDTAAAAAAPAGETNLTMGTKVEFRNNTGQTVWVREHHVFTDWYASDVLKPGEAKTYSGNYGGVDDVQLRVFRSAEDAKGNSVLKAIEVDAENPAWSSPWLSVSYHCKYYSVGTVHTYESPLAGAEFTGKRIHDGSHHKQFELSMTKGWRS